MPIRVECCPAFDYARAEHTTSIIPDESIADIAFSPTSPPTSPRSDGSGSQKKALFQSKELSLDLRYIAECVSPEEGGPGTCSKIPVVNLQTLDLSAKGHLGLGACCDLDLEEGQVVTFVLRVPPPQGSLLAKSTKPTRKQAEELGVSMQSKRPEDSDRLIGEARLCGVLMRGAC